MYIELLIFAIMIAVFIVILIVFKMPSSVALVSSAVVGALIAGFGLPIRHLIEGTFGYLDTIMTICASMIFMKIVEASGALDALGILLVEKLRRFPTILLIALMIIVMFPSMITGSSISAVVSGGGIVAPIMLAIGIPKEKTAAIIAFGALLGMIAPPVNIPVMMICEAYDLSYVGYTLPLLFLTVPVGIFVVLFLGRKHVRKINLDDLKTKLNFNIKNEVNATVYIPLILLIILMFLPNFAPNFMTSIGFVGLPLAFLVAAIPAFFFGKKVKLYPVLKDSFAKALPVMAMLLGVGMFIQSMALNGTRGYFVYLALSVPDALKYLSVAVLMPAFGGISVFGAASVLGGPLYMAFAQERILVPNFATGKTIGFGNICIVGSLSLIVAVGDILPPTATAGQFSAKMLGIDNYYGKVFKYFIVPSVVTILYGIFYLVVVGSRFFGMVPSGSLPFLGI